jgi:hypothetical protein
METNESLQSGGSGDFADDLERDRAVGRKGGKSGGTSADDLEGVRETRTTDDIETDPQDDIEPRPEDDTEHSGKPEDVPSGPI